MTEVEMERILATWIGRLRLRDWDIKINYVLRPGEKPDGTGIDTDNDAEIRVHDYHEQATIRLDATWGEWDSDKANRVIVHELLHVYERETWRPVDQAQNAMSKPAFEMLWGWYVAGRERWIEKLANAIVDMTENPNTQPKG